MPRACSVCTHPNHSEIDQALLRNSGYTAVARHFGLVDVSVRRHAVRHLSKLVNEIKQNYATRQGIADLMGQASKPTESIGRSMRGNESLVMGRIASAEEVLREISLMAMCDPRDFFDAHGRLLPMRQLPEPVARALAGFEVDDEGALKKIRLEKLRALENLAKHYGVVAADNSTQTNIVLNLSDEQLSRMEDILAYERENQQQRETIAGEHPPEGLVEAPPAPAAAETRAAREERIAAMLEQQQETEADGESRLSQPKCKHAPGTYCSMCVVDYATGVLKPPEANEAPTTPTPKAAPAAKPERRDPVRLRPRPAREAKGAKPAAAKPKRRFWQFWPFRRG